MDKEEIKDYMQKKKEESKINGTNLSDLNLYLFQELDRLNDSFIINREEELNREIKRSKSITDVAQTIINNAQTLIEAQKLFTQKGENTEIPKMLKEKND